MSEELKKDVEGKDSTGNNDFSTDVEKKEKKYIPADVYENVKNDMLKYKQEKRELAARLEEIEKKLKEEEERKLEEEKRFKELYEKEKQEKETMLNKFREGQILNALKFEALKQGMIDADDIKLIDRSNIFYNIETGQVEGVSEAVASLKEKKPYLFKNSEENKVNVDMGVSNTQSSVVTKFEDLLNNPALMQDYLKNHKSTYEKLRSDYIMRTRKRK